MPRRILIDVDGVLADMNSSMLAAIKEVTGHQFSPGDVTSWDYAEALGITPDEETRAWDILDQNLNFPEYPGARDAVRALKLMGLDVVFVTSPSHTPNWVPERQRWLKKRFGDSSLIVHTKHKWLIPGVALVDDKPENVEQWAAEHPDGIGVLWAQPWNVSAIPTMRMNVCRTRDWNVVYNLLKRSPEENESTRIAEVRSP